MINRYIDRVLHHCAVAMAFVMAAAAHGASNVVPLPDVSKGEVEMRVAHVINPRLPRMNAAQIEILLAAIKKTTLEHFGVTLRFTPVQEVAIDSFFSRIPPDRALRAARQIYDFKSGTGDLKRLARAYANDFRRNGGPLADQLAYAKPFFSPQEDSHESLGEVAAQFHISRIGKWRDIKALDGEPVIDAQPYNEYVMWDVIGYGDMPYELVLTNQVMVSAEYRNPALATAIRGGYSNGLTTYSKSSRVGSVAIWSTFAYSAKDEWVVQLRDGERYSGEEAAHLAGVGATHEIGHQLFHFLHPFGSRACVMNPVPMFAYRAWANALSPKDCPLGSSPAMRPGAFRFLF